MSGGLGPTHDDRTVEMVARALGRSLRVDAALESQIEGVSRAAAERLNRPYADFQAGVTKQATIPDGAVSLGLAGTAPGLLIEHDAKVVVVLPGPPSELQRLWPNALETDAFRALLAQTQPPGRRVLRFFGVSESAVARALAEAGGDGDGVEATICARDFEIHVDLVVEPGADARADALEEAFLPSIERWLYSRDERPIEEHVLSLCRAKGLRLATAESETGGLVAGRLTSIPGASDVFVGGRRRVRERGEGGRARRAGGAPRGARSRVRRGGGGDGARRAASGSGPMSRSRSPAIAGPGGGTDEKPVGLVYLHAEGPDGGVAREFTFPGDRASIRARSAVMALHLVRRLLTRSRDEAV